jgi:hypothetical protein
MHTEFESQNMMVRDLDFGGKITLTMVLKKWGGIV